MTNVSSTQYFAVLDVETNWNNRVMSVGVVVANADTFEAVNCAYYILNPECLVGGMYSSALGIAGDELTTVCSREDMIADMRNLFAQYAVCNVFAYNAAFDYGCLPELTSYTWHDIMRVSAYLQYNDKIPHYAECYSTGRLRRGGVESVMRLITGQRSYCETHNALIDAVDELQIMRIVAYPVRDYPIYLPKNARSDVR